MKTSHKLLFQSLKGKTDDNSTRVKVNSRNLLDMSVTLYSRPPTQIFNKLTCDNLYTMVQVTLLIEPTCNVLLVQFASYYYLL